MRASVENRNTDVLRILERTVKKILYSDVKVQSHKITVVLELSSANFKDERIGAARFFLERR